MQLIIKHFINEIKPYLLEVIITRILDVQELRKSQYDEYRKRRTSQFIKFLDKDVDFVTYYSVNKVESTYAFENGNVDSYIGDDSPVRYNKINNLPVYGIAQVSDINDFDDENGGLSNDNFSGEMILLPNIIEPCEGDAFIINIFDENRLFVVNNVSQTVLKSKPHYALTYHACIPEYINKINKQVSSEFNAIFDNIGTQDKVIISNDEYDLRKNYKDMYREFYKYYISSFFREKLTMFEITIPYDKLLVENKEVHYIDKFLLKFMADERIVVMDELLRDSLILDYNNIFDSNDYKTYKESLYWAISNRDISNMNESNNFISINKITSPFALSYGVNSNWYFTSDGFTVKTDNSFGVEFDFNTIISKYLQKDTSIDRNNPYTRILSIIVNYMHGNQIMPGYFSGIIDKLTELQEYELIPIIMYIIKEQINSLTKLNTII